MGWVDDIVMREENESIPVICKSMFVLSVVPQVISVHLWKRERSRGEGRERRVAPRG